MTRIGMLVCTVALGVLPLAAIAADEHVIATPDTDPAIVDTVTEFADHRLGKGIVAARDTPNFIANRIGLYGVMQILRAWATGAYTIEEIDAITGPAIASSRSSFPPEF